MRMSMTPHHVSRLPEEFTDFKEFIRVIMDAFYDTVNMHVGEAITPAKLENIESELKTTALYLITKYNLHVLEKALYNLADDLIEAARKGAGFEP